ncbi:Inner centromere protein [Halotydeus destructor]|nr:Inner centromere protein [Halotydeus destructor]
MTRRFENGRLVIEANSEESESLMNVWENAWSKFETWEYKSLSHICDLVGAPWLVGKPPVTTPARKKGRKAKKGKRPTMSQQGTDSDATNSTAFQSILNPSELNSTLTINANSQNTFTVDTSETIVDSGHEVTTGQVIVAVQPLRASTSGSLYNDKKEKYVKNANGSYTRASVVEETPPEDIDPNSPSVSTPTNDAKMTAPEEPEEWMTDDESELEQPKNLKKKQKPLARKKKQSEYFTPGTFIPRSTRANTRAISRLDQVSSVYHQTPSTSEVPSTPKVTGFKSLDRAKSLTQQMKEAVTSSGGSTSGGEHLVPGRLFGSAAKNRLQRLKAIGSGKDLTDSAQKRRIAAEERRRNQIQQQIDEKERKASAQKENLIKQRTLEAKAKREERERLVAIQKEAKEREEKEKRMLQEKMKEELERKKVEKEEARREEARNRHAQQILRQKEAEERKVQEEREQKRKQKLVEEQLKKRMEEADKARLEQERLAAMIQQHNSSLQQKAVANSFMKKQLATTSATKLPEIEPEPPKLAPVSEQSANSTFTMPKDVSKAENKLPTTSKPEQQSYDISDLKSDEDTDDERQPRKALPNWARGTDFMQALTKQYSKALKYREREIRSHFQEVQLPVELGLIFKGAEKIVSSRYAKRTSSAFWSSPPAHALNLSMSFNSSSLSVQRFDANNDSFDLSKNK